MLLFSYRKSVKKDNQDQSEGSSSEPHKNLASEDCSPTDSTNSDPQNSTASADNSEVQQITASRNEISPTTSQAASSVHDKPLVQTVLLNRFTKTTKAQAERITMAIAYLLAVACLAYSFVENIGFRHLMTS